MWAELADFAQDKLCEERRKFGKCGCKVQKCDLTALVQKSCISLDNGETPLVPPSYIKDWLNKRRCSKSKANAACNHAGCIKVEKLLDKLNEKLKAA